MAMLGLRDVFVVANPHHHDPNNLISDPHSLGVGVIPLLPAGPCLEDDNLLSCRTTRGAGMQLWQNNQHYLKKPISSSLDHHVHNSTATSNDLIGIGGGLGSSSSAATTTCQDCGNQAKKDCSHRRCRACCRSRGLECTTHVKSTWVPAARRRERQLMAVTAGSSGSTSGSKKPRLIASQATSHTSTSNTTPPRSADTSSTHQDGGLKEELPGQVRAPAVFKCVRVTAVEEGDDEFAYQAVVKIGGHVFKGFLYDQGVEPGDEFPNVSELHLGDGGTRNNRNVGATATSPLLHPSDVFNGGAAPGFLASSIYGN